MKLKIDKHINLLYLLAAFIIISFYVFNAFSFEIQPWDEAIYATRAKHALLYNSWIDQTSYSPGGLYSAVHPPLVIWLTALSMKIFSIGQTAIRIIPMIFSLLTCFVVYKAVKSKQNSSFAFLSLLSAPLFYHYSLMGQLDLPLTFFMTLSTYLFYLYELKRVTRLLIFSGIALGLALLSKAAFALILPASVAVYLLLRVLLHKKKIFDAIKDLAILSLIGFLILLPWAAYMYSKHGMEFINTYAFFHVIERMTTGVEGNARKLGYMFYVNQLLVFFPLVPIAFYALKEDIKTEKALFYISSIIITVIISVSKTKLPSYLIPALSLFAITAGFGLNKAAKEKHVPFLISGSVFLLIIWSFSQEFRDAIKVAHIAPLFSVSFLPIWIGIALLLMLFIFNKGRFSINTFSVILIIALTAKLLSFAPPFFNTNIEWASKEFKVNNSPGLIFFEPKNNSKISNPQISYYFDGIDMGLNNGKKYEYFNYAEKIDYTLLAQNKSFMVVCSKPTNLSEVYLFENNILPFAKKISESKQWDVFIIK